MQKRYSYWIRLALGFVVSAFAGAAQAQSSLTLYGIIDSGLLYANKVPTSSGANGGSAVFFTPGGFGPSVFGIRGREDLGGGVAASFDLESGMSTANGGYTTSNGNFWGRRAWVGIGGKYGELRAGVQASPFYVTIYESDPRDASSFAGAVTVYADNVGFTGGVNSNAITYLSPKVGGFKASVMFAPGGVAGDFQAGQQWSANASYDNGTLMVNAAMYHGNEGGTGTPVPTTVQFDGRTLGFVYRLNGLTLKLAFVNYDVARSFNADVYGGGVDYIVTPSISLNSGIWFSTDRNNKANHSLLVGLGAVYQLSVRTSLYAQGGTVSNRGKMSNGLSVTDFAIMHGVRNATTLGAIVGIRHAF